MHNQPTALLLGAYPPPTGGIAVHIKRLASLLVEAGFSVIVVDFYGRSPVSTDDGVTVMRVGRFNMLGFVRMLLFLLRSRFSVVHLHGSSFRRGALVSRALTSLIRARNRLVTIHSGSFVSFYDSSSDRTQNHIRRLLDRFDTIVCVGQEQREHLKNIGYPDDRLEVIPAFIAPKRADSSEIRLSIDELRDNVDLIVSTSGCGADYYGHHTILQAVALARENGLRIGLVFAFYAMYDEPYFSQLVESIGQTPNSLVYRDLSPEEFSDILYHSDVYVRATDRDGDAIAIREAIHWNCVVVATSAVLRPRGCLLFEFNDSAELASQLSKAAAGFTPSYEENAPIERLLELYRVNRVVQ
ncbi:MAG: glycosyltransferase family 4 protein [Rhodothermales bacterium]